MEQSTSPQGKENNVPWRISFGRKDLLAASWGSKKGADLLYHFLHRASWEAKNKHENETLKDIKFQESTPKALEKARLSLGSFHTYLKLFVSAGYVSHEAYTDEFIVHLDIIQQAFTKAPEKPVSDGEEPRQPRSKSFNLKDCNFVTLSREDYEMLLELKDFCFNLKDSLFQIETLLSTELKDAITFLKQNATINSNQEASSEEISDSQSKSNRDRDKSNREEREKGNSAIAPLPCARSFALMEIDLLSEDFPEAQANLSYSHNKPATDLQEKSIETSVTAASDGYTNKETPVNPPEKPKRGTSKQNVEQQGLPLQVDLGPLVMPASDAAWNASTAVIVSEVLREKRYTPMQRDNQINTAKRMVKAFPDMTRAQFEEVFTDWAKWWREHDKGFFTLADLMCKGKNNEVRLQSALDRLESQRKHPVSSPSNQTQQHVRVSSPNTAGYQPPTDEDRKRNFERLAAKRDAQRAAQASATQAAI